MPTEERLVQGFRFEVTFFIALGLGPIPVNALFRRVSGLGVSVETTPVGGGFNRFMNLQIPQRVNFPNITLERGLITGGPPRLEFLQVLAAFSIMPSSTLISLLDMEGRPLESWMLIGAYPVRWNLSDFNADSGEVVVETIELTYKTLMPMSL